MRLMETEVRICARTYRRSWEALDALNVLPSERQGLRVLEAADLTMLGKWLEEEQYRSSGQQLPWIWLLMPVPTGAVGEPFADTVNRWSREGELDPSWNGSGTTSGGFCMESLGSWRAS